MPTIQVPLPTWDQIPDLKKSSKFRRLADQMLSLKQQRELLEAKEAELRLEMYDVLHSNLDSHIKSASYEGYRFTRIDEGKSRRFDKGKLMQRPIRCEGCPTCKKKKVAVHVTAVDIEKCTVETSRRPTVQVAALKGSEEGSEGEEE